MRNTRPSGKTDLRKLRQPAGDAYKILPGLRLENVLKSIFKIRMIRFTLIRRGNILFPASLILLTFSFEVDKNFHDYMSRFMDKRIESAIGGTALCSFRITVDYPNAVAVFEN
jgi:hypothetical protein